MLNFMWAQKTKQAFVRVFYITHIWEHYFSMYEYMLWHVRRCDVKMIKIARGENTSSKWKLVSVEDVRTGAERRMGFECTVLLGFFFYSNTNVFLASRRQIPTKKDNVIENVHDFVFPHIIDFFHLSNACVCVFFFCIPPGIGCASNERDQKVV